MVRTEPCPVVRDSRGRVVDDEHHLTLTRVRLTARCI